MDTPEQQDPDTFSDKDAAEADESEFDQESKPDKESDESEQGQSDDTTAA